MLKCIKSELITQANNIPNFNSQAQELEYALNQLIAGHVCVVHYGFKLVLEMIEQYPTLIRPTLYGTLLVVRHRYRQLTKFKANQQEMNAVSLAVNHVSEIRKYRCNVKKAKAHANMIQLLHDDDSRICEQLATDIKDMLSVKIYALKVKGEGSKGAKPFMIGSTVNEVATVLDVSSVMIRRSINKSNRTVKCYRLWEA